MSMIQGFYQRIHPRTEDVVATFYISESPPGFEYRLDGGKWVYSPGTLVAKRIFDGDAYTDSVEKPPGLPPVPVPRFFGGTWHP